MSLGIRLPAPPPQPGTPERERPADDLAALARVAERAGFASLAVDPPESGAAWWDSVAVVSYLAAGTPRIRLLADDDELARRTPPLAARQWATVHALSGGRAILCVGSGPPEDGGGPDGPMDAAIDAVRAAQPCLPVWIRGSTPSALRRAADRSDGWMPGPPPEGGLSAAIERVHELRHRAGRGAEPFTVVAGSGPLYVGEPRWDVGRAVHGSPEQLAGFLRVLAGLGVDHIQVAFRTRDEHELHDQIRRFGAEVMPLVELATVR